MKRVSLLLVLVVVLAGCYDIDRVRPANIQKFMERYPERGIIYLTYSYYNPKKEFIDGLGVYRFLWNYQKPKETYYLLEMENTKSNEMVVYYTAPTVINPVDFVVSNINVSTIMLRHYFPEQPIPVQKGEIVYLGHIFIDITNSTVLGFVSTTRYILVWQDREAEDRELFYREYPMLTNWVWRKQIITLDAVSNPLQEPKPVPAPTQPPQPQVIYVTNVIVVTNTVNP